MRIRFKHKKLLRIIACVALFDLVVIGLFFAGTQRAWHTFDYKFLDIFYKKAVELGHGPQPSFAPQIVYLTIDDASYNAFGKNHLDRKDLAGINGILAQLGPEAVVYDIIFSRKSTMDSDQAFARSLEALGTAYLPLGLALSDHPIGFKGEKARILKGLDSPHLSGTAGSGEQGTPYYAVQAIVQDRAFAAAAAGSGNISVLADADSVYRRIPMVVKIDEVLYPTLGLSVFLDWAGVSFDTLQVEWGKQIFIPAAKENSLDLDLSIPIDQKGRAFVPFVNSLGADFRQMPVHTLVETFADENLRGNLYDFFEGNFVLIADVAVGTSDLGDTPLEANAPLVILHASVLNGLLTQTFYRPWPQDRVLWVIFLLGVLLMAGACLKSPWFLYGTGATVTACVLVFTWTQFLGFHLFPVATTLTVVLFVFMGLTITLEFAGSRDRAFIKNTFSKYVPKKVVAQLLDNPQLVSLGGEERLATVFFSDIAGFTSVSEKLSPPDLVGLLNDYFTEMTQIVLDHGGIIDKYLGDAIMAEFGVPLTRPDHADQAVTAALGMQTRLKALRKIWQAKGLPPLHCRVGINTGPMIVGNIGSTNVFDYTVIGDGVNLASRLEGANKRYGTSILISQDTLDGLTPERFKTRILDFVIVKGKTRAVKIYEVYGFQVQTENPALDMDIENHGYHQIYDRAFNAYLARDFSTADQGFKQALSLDPGDPASRLMIQRIQDIEALDSLPGGWDGSVGLTEK